MSPPTENHLANGESFGRRRMFGNEITEIPTVGVTDERSIDVVAARPSSVDTAASARRRPRPTSSWRRLRDTGFYA